jgi:16S rRNA (adenine1518-N6/adenine1519-N6)-dimethyltransferase
MPRRLGQHFLRDRGAIEKIVSALELQPDERVLEIGPGKGVLTRALAATGAKVTAIELDARLAAHLRSEMEPGTGVSVVEADALNIDPCEVIESPYKLAGNIPYYITGALIRRYLGGSCKPSLAVLMVQLEVARRILAKPGEMSLLALGVQSHAEVSLVTKVTRRSFDPPPKVDSAVVKMLIPNPPPISIQDEQRFFEIARAGFGTKRKQMSNAISHGLGLPKAETIERLVAAGIRPSARAEDLSLDDWSRLEQSLS